ncbi:hypothetical protein O1611_g860 [Lasiodiplodia mahajangana]|uniref:Uncharacterized protein n=1 Tax=Lasiodiplodia mahajangana TaxID=1108764 RepID=A0ACC2JZC3_9PEZI|nr:hypothetical protein O1611_g860 [Lasiodiplodia mahajangana]
MEHAAYSKLHHEGTDPDLAEVDIRQGENYRFLNPKTGNYLQRIYQATKGRWVAVTVVIWFISLLLTWKIASVVTRPRYDVSLGLNTELEPLKSQIEMQVIRFTGDLDWDENGTLIRTHPGPIEYVGDPTPEIDAAWEHLIFGEAVDLKGDEARTIEGTTFQKAGGWWVLGIEVFHHLHCLNMIRKTLHLDYYGINEDSMERYNTHIEHCIDSIRQALMCTSDITPFTVEWNTRYHRPRPDFITTPHTCRNFEKLRDWALEHATEQHPKWI